MGGLAPKGVEQIPAFLPAEGGSRIAIHRTLICLLLIGSLAGCGPAGPATAPRLANLADAVPGPEALDGWTLAGEAEIYDRDGLYGLVNGQADLFFAYGFAQAAVQDYQAAGGATMRLTIWQLATPQDAYGLLTFHASGPTAGVRVDVGNEASLEAGQRLVFWQDHYFLDLFASPPQAGDESLLALARAASSRLPSGGEPPAVMASLPAGGLVAHSAVFFHQEIAIQDRLWLGGENVLALGAETDGVLARYDLQGTPAQLLLVHYPTAEAAAAGLAALQAAAFDDLAASGVRAGLLATVWGGLDDAPAQELLSRALNGGE